MNRMLTRPIAAARRGGLIVSAALACALAAPAVAPAALGDLDPSYGSGGIAGYGAGAPALDVQDGYVDSAGRAVIAGVANGVGIVARVSADGNGFEWSTSLPDQGLETISIAPAPSGHVVAVGSDASRAINYVRRVSAVNGALDPGFGTPVDRHGHGSEVLQDVTVRPSGQILAAGWHSQVELPDEFLVKAYHGLTGQPDLTFNGDVGWNVPSGTTGTSWRANTLAVDSAGRIILAGTSDGDGLPFARFDADGAFDQAWTLTGSAPNDVALESLMLPGDRLAVAGIAAGQPPQAMLVRLAANLAPDAAFGTGGIARFPEGIEFAALATDLAGGLLAAGSDGERALLAKVDDRGAYDPVLGAAESRPGLVAVDPVNGPDVAVGVGVDGADRAHVLGWSVPPSDVRGPLATRHQPNAAPAAAFTGPAELETGQAALFDAAPSTDPERALRRFEWDLDGDGAFETDGGAERRITHAFATPGALGVGLRVTDHAGLTATTTRTVTVTSRAPQPRPVLGRSGVLTPVSGTIRVRRRGSKTFREVSTSGPLENGAEVDARRGRVTITVARDASGATDSSDFYLGRFIFRQGSGRSPYTTLSLSGGNFKGCGPAKPKLKIKIATGAAKKKSRRRVIRRLWGDGKGKFRTKGRYASATVRGTRWQTIDRCNGVSLDVRSGVVTFQDLLRGGKPRRVRAGKKAFVPSRRQPR